MKIHILLYVRHGALSTPELLLTEAAVLDRLREYWDLGFRYSMGGGPVRKRDLTVAGYVHNGAEGSAVHHYALEPPELSEALESFFTTIDSTGGVIRDPKGYYEPVGDRDWIDLGESYMALCCALRRKPMVEDCDESGLTASERPKSVRKRKPHKRRR